MHHDNLPDALRPMNFPLRRKRFMELLETDEMIVAPGVYDAFSARIVEQIGFSTVYLGSGNFCASHYGTPDLGILTPHEMAAATRRIATAVSVPVIVDVDTGYGGPFQVAVHLPQIVDAGAAAAQIEDQVLPKRCGHLDGKSLISPSEMCRKLEVARRATPDDFSIIARTDAVAVEGVDAAIKRAHAYVDAGADLIFVEAPLSDGMLGQIGASGIQRPLIANMVYGGVTPLRSQSDLHAMGYKMVIYAGAAVQAAGAAVRSCLGGLHESGELPESVPMLTLAERTALIQQEQWNSLQEHASRTLVD